MFDDLSCLVLSRTITVSSGSKSTHEHGPERDSYKYHPKILTSTFKVKVIEGHDVKKGQKGRFG